MGWTKDHEAVLRNIVDTNCTLVGALTDGNGNHCFWGAFLVRECGYTESAEGTLRGPEGDITTIMVPSKEAPNTVVDRLMSANDNHMILSERKAALHSAITKLIEEER